MLNQPEFCKYCGAGVGKFKREGEGTCHRCDPVDPELAYRLGELYEKYPDDPIFNDKRD